MDRKNHNADYSTAAMIIMMRNITTAAFTEEPKRTRIM